MESPFLKALELRKNKNSKKYKENFTSLPDIKINNHQFFKDETFSGFLLHVTRVLGFDCKTDTPIILYKDNGYVTIQSEKYSKWNDSYKNRNIIRHYKSYTNRWRYSKLVEVPIELYHFEQTVINKEGQRELLPEVKKKYSFKYHEEIEKMKESLKGDDVTFEQKQLMKKTVISERLKFNNVSLREYQYSEILCIDIDTHNYELFSDNCPNPIEVYENFSLAILKELKSLPVNLLLFERSKIGRGIHAYVKLENIHNKEIVKSRVKTFLEERFQNISVEFRSKTKSLRLPFTYDYEFINIDTLKKENKLKKKIKIVLERFEVDAPVTNDSLIKFLDLKICTTKKENKPFQKVYIFERDKIFPIKLKQATFSITEGNRIGGEGVLWDIAFYSVRMGYTLSQFIDLVNASQVSSKDLAEWSNTKKYYQLSKIFDFASAKYNVGYSDKYKFHNIPGKSKPSSFISNLHLLTDNQKENINFLIDRILYEKIKTNGDNKWLRTTISDCRVVFPELIGKILFEKSNPRKVNQRVSSSLYLTKEKAEDLTVGTQFPKEYLEALKSYYPSLSRNIHHIFSIFKESFLEIYYHKSNPSTYYIPSLGSSIQYLSNEVLSFFVLSNTLLSNQFRKVSELFLDWYDKLDLVRFLFLLKTLSNHTYLCSWVLLFGSRYGPRLPSERRI